MNDGYAWWLVIVGIAIGIALVWLVLVRLPRSEDDIDAAELSAEASWIGRTIEAYGGIAPQALVEEVLELHHAWLAAGGGTPVVPRAPGWPDDGQEAEDAAERGRTAPRAG
jgi:cyanate permease